MYMYIRILNLMAVTCIYIYVHFLTDFLFCSSAEQGIPDSYKWTPVGVVYHCLLTGGKGRGGGGREEEEEGGRRRRRGEEKEEGGRGGGGREEEKEEGGREEEGGGGGGGGGGGRISRSCQVAHKLWDTHLCRTRQEVLAP